MPTTSQLCISLIQTLSLSVFSSRLNIFLQNDRHDGHVTRLPWKHQLNVNILSKFGGIPVNNTEDIVKSLFWVCAAPEPGLNYAEIPCSLK